MGQMLGKLHRSYTECRQEKYLRNMKSKSYIKEDDILVSISIMTINGVESLWELHVANFLSYQRIHHKTHCFLDCLAVVHIVITIQVQHIWSVR